VEVVLITFAAGCPPPPHVARVSLAGPTPILIIDMAVMFIQAHSATLQGIGPHFYVGLQENTEI
jgi:hypothetical protein